MGRPLLNCVFGRHIFCNFNSPPYSQMQRLFQVFLTYIFLSYHILLFPRKTIFPSFKKTIFSSFELSFHCPFFFPNLSFPQIYSFRIPTFKSYVIFLRFPRYSYTFLYLHVFYISLYLITT